MSTCSKFRQTWVLSSALVSYPLSLGFHSYQEIMVAPFSRVIVRIKGGDTLSEC